jgi:hypothetical protein
MELSTTKNQPYPQQRPDAADVRLDRFTLILCLALLGVAGLYFGSLYLITH